MKESTNQNLVSGKIRRLLHNNPDAGFKELEELFGTLSRSVRVIYYKIHKEMFGVPGNLKQGRQRTAPKQDKIVEYFRAHPDHTIDDAAKTLRMKRKNVYGITYKAIRQGENITFRKQSRDKDETCVSAHIREYLDKNPGATSRECAEAVGTKVSYVSLVKYRDRFKKTS